MSMQEKMCECGHTRRSHVIVPAMFECIGCTGPDCDMPDPAAPVVRDEQQDELERCEADIHAALEAMGGSEWATDTLGDYRNLLRGAS